MASGKGDSKLRRSYQPAVESLEALRMPSGAAHALPELTVECDLFGPSAPIEAPASSLVDAAWEDAQVRNELVDFLGSARDGSEDDAIAAGLSQLDRYLGRTWSRAGVAVQQHDDCSQAVYATLLLILGRVRFDQLVGAIGRRGIRKVLNRETRVGPDFFRAVDAVKKRVRRERRYQPLDRIDVVALAREDESQASWRGELQEAIDQALSQREAALIYATLKGETPAEIALQWGVAPKTVSNEKTRVIQKLRGVLVGDSD